MNLLPSKRPQASRPEILTYINNANLHFLKSPVIVVGIRGYYANSFGKPNLNDRGCYDDAFFLVSVRAFKSFNGNVDPSLNRSGIASLIAGIYQAIKWMHKGKYRAYQIKKDRVTRDGLTGIDEGKHGINFHKGRAINTDSVGCQTIPESQYGDFVTSVDAELNHYGREYFTYLLIDKTK